MKTDFVAKGITPAVKDGLISLQEIDIEAFRVMCEAISEQDDPRSLPPEEVVLSASKKYSVSFDDLFKALNVSFLLLTTRDDSNDSINDILDDLSKLDIVSNESKENIIEKLEINEKLVYGRTKSKLQELEAIKSIFTTLRVVDYECSLAVNSNSPKRKSANDVNKIDSTDHFDIYPVVVLDTIIYEMSKDRRYSVALSESELDSLIKELNNAKSRLTNFSKWINKKI
jgi:hypothetical protein